MKKWKGKTVGTCAAELVAVEVAVGEDDVAGGRVVVAERFS